MDCYCPHSSVIEECWVNAVHLMKNRSQRKEVKKNRNLEERSKEKQKHRSSKKVEKNRNIEEKSKEKQKHGGKN